MTPEQLKAACNALPMTHEQIAKEIGVSYQHLLNCRSGSRSLSKSAVMLLERLAE